MTASQAVELCLQQYEEYVPADRRSTPSGEPRTFERQVSPHWFVLIPASNEYGKGYIQCIIGGTYENPTSGGVGAVVDSVVTDEYIQYFLNENGGL